jgi:hypothetical protein
LNSDIRIGLVQNSPWLATPTINAAELLNGIPDLQAVKSQLAFLIVYYSCLLGN